MAKEPEKSQPALSSVNPGSPANPQQQQRPLQLDDSHVAATSYANFCRVTGTPEELIIDFGLNPQPMGVPNEPLAINQRIILNFFTAKRLLAALHMTLERHESAFGVLETDVQKRVQQRSSNRPGQQAAP